MRETQKSQPDDFDCGVQAGLKTAANLLERLAVRVQEPEPAPPRPRPAPQPASQPRPLAGRQGPAA
jgi:hypothetical protein